MSVFTRIALFKLHEGVGRDAFAQRLHQTLSALEGLASLQVGLPADAAAEKSWDLSVVLTFQDADALRATLASEPYREAFEGALAQQVHVLKAWNFAAIA